jgi:hypothetical protein
MKVEEEVFNEAMNAVLKKNGQLFQALAYSNILNDPWVELDSKVIFMENGKEKHFEYTSADPDLLDRFVRYSRTENGKTLYVEFWNENKVSLSQFDTLKKVNI